MPLPLTNKKQPHAYRMTNGQFQDGTSRIINHSQCNNEEINKKEIIKIPIKIIMYRSTEYQFPTFPENKRGRESSHTKVTDQNTGRVRKKEKRKETIDQKLFRAKPPQPRDFGCSCSSNHASKRSPRKASMHPHKTCYPKKNWNMQAGGKSIINHKKNPTSANRTEFSCQQTPCKNSCRERERERQRQR